LNKGINHYRCHVLFPTVLLFTYLTEDVKSKEKSLVTFSIIGLVLSILMLISGINGFKEGGVLFSELTNTPYIIIFSIVMLIRSFRKPKEMRN